MNDSVSGCRTFSFCTCSGLNSSFWSEHYSHIFIYTFTIWELAEKCIFKPYLYLSMMLIFEGKIIFTTLKLIYSAPWYDRGQFEYVYVAFLIAGGLYYCRLEFIIIISSSKNSFIPFLVHIKAHLNLISVWLYSVM